MLKLILLAAFVSGAFAGKSYGQSGHYYASCNGINGYRTVSEENAYMQEVLSERRRKEREESGQPAENQHPVVKAGSKSAMRPLAVNGRKPQSRMKR